ncbi:MAG: DNA translocase FtsK 4TM domain-containing protein [Patescibacteria group bacterium]
MGRRRGKYKKRLFNNVSLPKFDLDPDIKKGIFIVFILAFGATSLLSLFDLAGQMGVYLNQGMMLIFGWGKWLFPPTILALGFLFYNEERHWVKGANYLGLFLFAISFNGLLHLLFINQALWHLAIDDGTGGGYLGLIVVLCFTKIMGFWASLVVLACLLIISLMLMFNATLQSLIGSNSWFAKIIYPINFLFNKIFQRSNNNYVNEKEENESIAETEENLIIAETGDSSFKSHKIKTAAALFAEEAVDKIEENNNWKSSHKKVDLPLDLLNAQIGKPTSGDIKNNSLIIQKSLENFGISCEMGDVNIGPTVTQYTLRPADGIKLTRITTLSNDLAMTLAAHPIRIEAPIPGKSLVGIEVPNQIKAIVGLREVLSSEMFIKRKNNLMIGLGKDVSGKVWLDDICKMPHLLVAGATNSGKSVCLNSIIISLLYQNGPDDLRFIMVDPKRVELPVYNGIPHLLTPVITEVSKTINALKWCLNEMDRRFELLARHGKRNIESYNNNHQQGEDGKLPYIIFIIDELADLMVAASRDIEGGIIRLAQMSRAVGIHLILATQRPSVNIITGLIKANMPARIAFSVASGVDSRTILDSLGAEKLLGRGDMLFTTAEISKPRRIQGAFVSDNEIKRIVNYIKEKGDEPDYIEEVIEKQKVNGVAGVGLNDNDSNDDNLLPEAKEVIINSGKASASYLQRRFSIGYARAARLLDLLEQEGIIGPTNGSKPREVLISQDQYDRMINQGVSGMPLHKQEEMEAPDEYLPEDKTEEVEGESFDEMEIEENNSEKINKIDNLKNKKLSQNQDDEEDDGKYFSR